MKKINLAIVTNFSLCLLIAFLFNACSTQTESASENKADNTATEEVVEKEKPSMVAVANFDADFAAASTTLEAYFVLKDALVATKADLAQKAAGKLAELSEGDVKAAAASIAASTDVKEQRNLFNTISQQMYETIKAEGAGETIYKQYCPMAFNNEGAYWLSSEEKIMNPYFGDMMLNCGRVDETLQASAD